MKVSLALALALAATAAVASDSTAAGAPAGVAARGAAADGARDFELGLDEVERMMDVRRWGRARERLLALLEEHRDADYVHARAAALREILGRCALWERYPEPDPDDLVAGDVLDWDRDSGRVRVRYRGAALRGGEDFEQVGAYRVHPLDFVGPYELELRGQVPAADPTGLADTPIVAVAVQPRDMLLVAAGHAPVASGGRPAEQPAAVLRAAAGAAAETLAVGGTSPAGPGARYTFRVEVDGRGVRASWNGRALVAWRAAKLAGGRTALTGLAGVEEVVLSGHADSAWLAGRVDAAAQVLRTRFRREVRESDYVPAWLLAGPRRPGGREDGAPAPAASRGPRSEAALALERLSVRAARGPAWPRSWTVRSRRYEVRTDVDEAAGERVASTLEETTLALQRLLGGVDELAGGAARARVHVFSSPDGYRDYVDQLGVEAPENAAGLYSPGLRQLLLLHVGDRDLLTRTARHENVHLYLDARLERCPMWLEEGLAEYFETLALERGHVVAGAANAEHVALLVRPDFRWRALGEVVALERDAFYADALRSYAESWALVHYLARGDGAPRGVLRDLVADLAAGREPDARLGDLEDLDRRVRTHLAGLAQRARCI